LSLYGHRLVTIEQRVQATPPLAGCIQVDQELADFGAQGRSTTIQSIQSLMEKWDNKSSHMIIMLSGRGVPLLSDPHRRTLASQFTFVAFASVATSSFGDMKPERQIDCNPCGCVQ
jgi:hypothetical protein